ncbi:MAG TPA: ATP-dependent helicase, partial [Aggregatilineales bacterium]|nr:ATP-dependent helicase [Aggregatilineales bacterium]
QRTLSFRAAVDFDDLVGLALMTLELDPQYLARLQERWVYILEDEAQDSSRLQEKMLRLLTKERNWVRVGDPNQAINTTFTTADSEYLVRFLAEKGVVDRKLPVSGRSGQPIINLANELVRWTMHDHPVTELRGAFYEQYIKPTEPDDPQQNPPADETRIHIHYQPDMPVSPERELELVRDSLVKWLPENPDKTVALLVPENSRGFKLAEILRTANIDYEELLRSTTGTRVAASYLCSILNYLAAPHDSNALGRFYREVWLPLSVGPAMEDDPDYERVNRALVAVRFLEELVWSDVPVVETLKLDELNPAVESDLLGFLEFVRYCLAALALPIDQLILTIGQRIFTQPVEIALTYKISALLRRFALENSLWRLTDFVSELRSIVDNQRRFIGFEDSSEGYSPSPGLPTISTMHAAKGLEWDRVYLLGVSNYGFPSVQPYDDYVSERWFVESRLSVVDEALEQFYALLADRRYLESVATYEARLAYSAERLRLLYVAMTRARRDLVVTWNIGRYSAVSGVQNRLAMPVLGIMDII